MRFYVGEFKLSNGSGPIGILAFPGAPWNRRTKLPSNISSLSSIGGEAHHNSAETIGAIRTYVLTKTWSRKSTCPSHHRQENSRETLHNKF